MAASAEEAARRQKTALLAVAAIAKMKEAFRLRARAAKARLRAARRKRAKRGNAQSLNISEDEESEMMSLRDAIKQAHEEG